MYIYFRQNYPTILHILQQMFAKKILRIFFSSKKRILRIKLIVNAMKVKTNVVFKDIASSPHHPWGLQTLFMGTVLFIQEGASHNSKTKCCPPKSHIDQLQQHNSPCPAWSLNELYVCTADVLLGVCESQVASCSTSRGRCVRVPCLFWASALPK